MSGPRRRWPGLITAIVLRVATVVIGVVVTAPAAPADTGAACGATFTIERGRRTAPR